MIITHKNEKVWYSRFIYSFFRLLFIRINCVAELFCSRTAGGSLAPQNDGWVRSQTGHPPSLILENLTGLSSCYLATFSASMETDVREVKGNSEIQTSVSLH